MASKKPKTSSELLKLVWKNYVETKLDQSEMRRWNLAIEAPCPICGMKISKTQFVEEQPKGQFAWKIVHLDHNMRNNELDNLELMHVKCNLPA